MILKGDILDKLKRECSIDMLLNSIEYKDNIYMADITYYVDCYNNILIYSNVHSDYVCSLDLPNGTSLISETFVKYMNYTNKNIEYNAYLMIYDIYKLLLASDFKIDVPLKYMKIENLLYMYDSENFIQLNINY